MTNKIKVGIASSFAILGLASQANAAVTQIVLAGASTNYTFAAAQDGSSNNYALSGFCGNASSATPGAAIAECAEVNASGQILTLSSQTGTWTVTANAGTNLNTSALALSANQPTNAAQGSTTSGQTGPIIQGAVTTGAPSYTTAQTSPLSLDTNGNLRVAGALGSNASVGATGSAVTASATLSGMNVSGNMTALTGSGGNLNTGAPANSYAAGFSPDMGNGSTASPWSGSGTPSLISLMWGVYNQLANSSGSSANSVRGTASQTGTSATTLIAAQGASIKLYITGVQCKNTGTTTTIVTLNDTQTTGSGTILIVPTLGGDNEVYQTPLVVAANTALTFTPSAGSTTIYCNAQGSSGA